MQIFLTVRIKVMTLDEKIARIYRDGLVKLKYDFIILICWCDYSNKCHGTFNKLIAVRAWSTQVWCY